VKYDFIITRMKKIYVTCNVISDLIYILIEGKSDVIILMSKY